MGKNDPQKIKKCRKDVFFLRPSPVSSLDVLHEGLEINIAIFFI
jgi:hypothetical protein